MASLHLYTRTGPPPYPNPLSLPTTPLQQKGLAALFLFPALSIIIVSMRMYSRVTSRTVGLDDWLVLAALFFALMMIGPLYMFMKLNYWGFHERDVPKDLNLAAGFWWNFLVQMFYNPVLALVKASILVFLLRLGGHKTNVRYAIYGLNIFNAAHAVAIFFTALFQCWPIEANWDFPLRKEPGVHCVNNWFHVIASCITIVTDFLVVALPFWIFLGLTMRWATKIAVLSVFLLGSVVGIIGIIRVISIYHQLVEGPKPGEDTFYSVLPVWGAVETNLAIICASVPALRPLFRRWFPALFGGSSDAPSGTPYGGRYANNSRGTGGIRSHNHDDIRLKDLRVSRTQHTEIRSVSPTGSEEEIMTYNGIMRTTNVQVAYENASKATVSESRTSSEIRFESKASEVRSGI
ncbi:hypothetical protein FOXG_09789 [Fusarium oxysporum f. sp. lycopersici 4287]|uniref:Rhodopsin domain-containing protein n=2 Tax=Fusarium oxysporum TaxID=5507 RepID=A0A0J9VCE7_FUSO4|nr:hypothetical protein FOXG_09789 [Fusarium oxysporum f. sp. lycopersici 4287]EXK29191.1 hypothetical protein FOMG_14366 [Fusarium oxysporum f. sp. melonis 26406]KAJ9416305.1 hypothetical protein QL093DRAFT_2434366 [Fusarium oxysporum]KNB09154.1 hypothetical protein FOXG_09789 [Fusarium oxysporum f. sp. lycopersici 4287]